MPKHKFTKTDFVLDISQEFLNYREHTGLLPNNYKRLQQTVNTQQSHDTLSYFQQSENYATSTSVTLQTQNCLDGTKESVHSTTDVQKNEAFKPKNLLYGENKSSGDDSSSMEDSDSPASSQLDQKHSNPELGKTLCISTKFCDVNSNSKKVKGSHEHSQLENGLLKEKEFCDNIYSESDTTMSASPKETESHSTSLSAACDPETDHSSSSAMVEEKCGKSDAKNSADSPPSQDLKRSRRNSKRKRDSDDHCPVCSITLRATELESHFAKEVENLSTIARNIKSRRATYRSREGFRCGINLAYIQARNNRENRNAARRETYLKKHSVSCPVCKIRISGTDEEINEHVFDCFREDDESDIDVSTVDYEDNFEEYEFGNETRIRAISLVPGGHRSLHGYSSRSRPANDEDVGDLNVDVDDTSTFGDPQELDVIHNYPHTSSSSDKRENEQLRKAVVSDPSAKPHVIEGSKWSQNCEIQNEIDEITGSCAKDKPIVDKSKENEGKDTEMQNNKEKENSEKAESAIISSLKKKIMDLENQKNIKCLICLEPYTRPVVSTTCWHVHCEECWLVSMGVKKLCPQCNMIVFPTDLRRIYI